MNRNLFNISYKRIFILIIQALWDSISVKMKSLIRLSFDVHRTNPYCSVCSTRWRCSCTKASSFPSINILFYFAIFLIIQVGLLRLILINTAPRCLMK